MLFCFYQYATFAIIIFAIMVTHIGAELLNYHCLWYFIILFNVIIIDIFLTQIGRDERVHLSENDVIENQKQDTEDAEQHLDPAAAGDDEAADWPAKSENLLQDASEQGKRKTICKKIQGEYNVDLRA